tara:strand:- start:74 stop:490 length:417 start_codon:yes stop_codon:yes gene_type:complete
VKATEKSSKEQRPVASIPLVMVVGLQPDKQNRINKARRIRPAIQAVIAQPSSFITQAKTHLDQGERQRPLGVTHAHSRASLGSGPVNATSKAKPNSIAMIFSASVIANLDVDQTQSRLIRASTATTTQIKQSLGKTRG